MAAKIIGKCYICKKEVTQHDLTYVEEGEKYPAVLSLPSWPGDGFLCAEHPGVLEDYKDAKNSPGDA